MDVKIPSTLVKKVFSPVIDQVTLDPEPSGSMVNRVSLRAFHGFSNARSIRTVEGSVASVISIRP